VRYSVWNNGTRSYDYYVAPGTPDIHAGAPPRVHGSALGATPEQAAWRLPFGSRRAGSGEMPQGRIASLGDAGGGGFLSSPGTTIVYAALGYLLWRTFR
jgi:hypothetical protein